MASLLRSKRGRRLVGLAVLACVLLAAGVFFYRWNICRNFGVVVPGQVYRSGQPTASQVRDWAQQYGLKTIVNLRGEGDGGSDVAEAISLTGIQLLEARCSARELPSALWVRRMVEILDTAPRPMLIYCRNGADRTSVASVMAAMAVDRQPYEQALGQLSVMYGQIDPNPMHLAGLLRKYEQYCRSRATQPAGWDQFRKWALEEYYPEYFKIEIRAPAEIHAVAGKLQPVEVVIINRSDAVLPSGDAAKLFRLSCFSGSSLADTPDREFGGRVELPRGDLAPVDWFKLVYIIDAPSQTGTYTVHFDLVEEGRTWFGRQGSPVATSVLVVEAP